MSSKLPIIVVISSREDTCFYSLHHQVTSLPDIELTLKGIDSELFPSCVAHEHAYSEEVSHEMIV